MSLYRYSHVLLPTTIISHLGFYNTTMLHQNPHCCRPATFFFARGDDVRWFNGRISKWKAAESGVYGGSCSAHVASSCFIKTEMLLNLSMRERERDGQTAVGECRLVPRLRKNTAFPPYTSTTPIHSTWHSMLPYFSLARATFPIFHWGWEC